jgi:putative phosphoesterase
MRIAVISDIHSNLPALERVLAAAEAEKADKIVCLGDIVGYGPFPNECVNLVRQRCSTVVRGNHDAGAVGLLSTELFTDSGRAAIEWTRDRLTPENQEFLRETPIFVVADDITLTHATPDRPESWNYVATWKDAEAVFPHFPTPLCFIGHTHVPAMICADGTVNDYRPGLRHLINAGSVGQPRDGNPKASFVLLDTINGTVEILRVDYPVATTAAAIRDAGLPDFLARRLSLGI